jgi:uncharacterized protein DUF3592
LGLIIDVVIAYLIKLIVRVGLVLESKSWKQLPAKIDSSSFADEWVWNCPTVHVTYSFQLDGQNYSGEDSKPFFFSGRGEDDAERFKAGQTVVVRVNPHRPQRSVLRRADQITSGKTAV